ncbi:MAG: LamG-like jellyroll fold domain-containing protein [Bacteroidota bacterium]
MQKLSIILLGLCFALSALTAQNSALHFDADNNKVNISNHPFFDIGEEFTIEAWINASVWRSESWQGSIVTKDQQGPDAGFAFRAGKSGTLSFVMAVNNTWNEIQSSPRMNLRQWHHVAAVVERGKMRLFIDGEQAATGNYSGTPSNNFRPVSIGASSGFQGRVFDGVIDDVRIWTVARTAEQLTEFADQNLSGEEEGLVAYFPMNEGTGNRTINLANPNLSGRLQNMEESDWVTGYSFPSTDVGVTTISDPDVWSVSQRPVRFRVAVKNHGEDPVSDFPVLFYVNGEEVHREIVEGELASGESIEIVSSRLFDLTRNNGNEVSISTDLQGDANPLNNSLEIFYPRPDKNGSLRIVDGLQHNFSNAGQTHFTNLIFPYDWEGVERLLMHISVDCPSLGCDPWDQPAKISVFKDGEELEIVRFVTPYRKACGPWTVDVTDFKELLTGKAAIKSYIQVFGPSGWLLNVDLEVVRGEAELPYQRLNLLWGEDYWVYGDPSVEDDLPARAVEIAMQSQAAHFRMTMSGHGQGNTENAAEFSDKTHQVVVNNNTIANHRLWKSDCAENECDNQQGTWLFSRAGWCPGEAVYPFTQDLTELMQVGETMNVDYQLQSYTNLLNTNYNSTSHTEPHYRIWAYLVEQSDQRYIDYSNLTCEKVKVEVDTVDGEAVYGPIVVQIKNTGNQTLSNPIISYYNNGELLAEEVFMHTLEPGAIFARTFAVEDDAFDASIANQVHVLVSQPEDENMNDDAALFIINENLLSSTKIVTNSPIQIYPNPSEGIFQVNIPSEIQAQYLRVFDLRGRVVLENQLQGQSNARLDVQKEGLFFVEITAKDGIRYLHKVSVLGR